MRYRPAVSTSVLVGITLVSLVASGLLGLGRQTKAAESTVVVDGIVIPVGELQVLEDTETLYAAIYRVDGTEVATEARWVDETDEAIAKDLPDGLELPSARVAVTVDGVTIVAWKDASGIAYIDGRDQSVLTSAKIALISLTTVLPLALPTDEAPLPHEDLLSRFVNYWAEAPAGYQMPSKLVISHEPRPRSEAEFAAMANECVYKINSAGDLGILDCQVSDQNGIIYLPCDQAPPAYLWTNYHDASGHCWTGLRQDTGPCSGGCLGRCGAGCSSGGGAYTLDCADHDSCCRHHGGGTSCWNPFDGSCGDEFGDADEDFTSGNVNCDGVNDCG